MAGDGGDGVASVGFLPRRFGKFSNIRDFGRVGSGDIKLKCQKFQNNLIRFQTLKLTHVVNYWPESPPKVCLDLRVSPAPGHLVMDDIGSTL